MTVPPLVTAMYIGLALLTVHAYHKYVYTALPDRTLTAQDVLKLVGQTIVFVTAFILASLILMYLNPFITITLAILAFIGYAVLRPDVHDKLHAYRAYRQRRDEGTHP